MTEHVRINHLRVVVAERKRDAAKSSRRSLCDARKSALEELGDDFSDFAVAAWACDGDLRPSYDPDAGLIGPVLISTLLGDAFNRHVALDMAPPVLK
jgi:hypothetical protein